MSLDNPEDQRLAHYQIQQLSEHLKRIGDSLREEAKSLSKLTAEVKAKDILLDYRLSSLEASAKKNSDSRNSIWIGIIISLTISAIELFFKR